MKECHTKTLGLHGVELYLNQDERLKWCRDNLHNGKIKMMIQWQFLTPLVQTHTMVYGDVLGIVGWEI